VNILHRNWNHFLFLQGFQKLRGREIQREREICLDREGLGTGAVAGAMVGELDNPSVITYMTILQIHMKTATQRIVLGAVYSACIAAHLESRAYPNSSQAPHQAE